MSVLMSLVNYAMRRPVASAQVLQKDEKLAQEKIQEMAAQTTEAPALSTETVEIIPRDDKTFSAALGYLLYLRFVEETAAEKARTDRMYQNILRYEAPVVIQETPALETPVEQTPDTQPASGGLLSWFRKS